MQEMRDYIKGCCDRTFSRDIALLKQAGVPIRFSGRRKAFVLTDEAGNESPRRFCSTDPKYPENKKERQFIEKIIRLTTMMSNLPYEDCDAWYRKVFPRTSKRTMQRDFAALRTVGYNVYYKRRWEYPGEDISEEPPGHYYYDEV
jgi:predicted DNA-binding transcriptional regulator YafY